LYYRSTPESARIEKQVAEFVEEACRVPAKMSRAKHAKRLMKTAKRAEMLSTIESWPTTCRMSALGLIEIESGLCIDAGDFPAAIKLLQRHLEVAAAVGLNDEHVKQRTLLALAGCHVVVNQIDKAQTCLREAISLLGQWLPRSELSAMFRHFLQQYCMILDNPRSFQKLQQLALDVVAEYNSVH
jgi:hypothetical protein